METSPHRPDKRMLALGLGTGVALAIVLGVLLLRPETATGIALTAPKPFPSTLDTLPTPHAALKPAR